MARKGDTMNTIKEIILALYWLPNSIRCLLKIKSGRFFVFRDEPNGFLRWISDARTESDGKKYSKDVENLYAEAEAEIAARKRMGTWT